MWNASTHVPDQRTYGYHDMLPKKTRLVKLRA